MINVATEAEAGLLTTPETQPKYSAWVWQLNRIEMLLDAAENGYATSDSSTGRQRMVSALELLYINLSPKLSDTDRKNIQTQLIRLRQMVDRIDTADAFTSLDMQQQITIMRKIAFQVIEIMVLVKERKGYGVPNKENKNYAEELAEGLDVVEEDIAPVEETKEGAKNE